MHGAIFALSAIKHNQKTHGTLTYRRHHRIHHPRSYATFSMSQTVRYPLYRSPAAAGEARHASGRHGPRASAKKKAEALIGLSHRRNSTGLRCRVSRERHRRSRRLANAPATFAFEFTAQALADEDAASGEEEKPVLAPPVCVAAIGFSIKGIARRDNGNSSSSRTESVCWTRSRPPRASICGRHTRV